MDTLLLFRKRTPLVEDHIPWLRGGEEHSWTARRNRTGKAAVSAILVRALLSTLDGCVLEAHSIHFRCICPGDRALAHPPRHHRRMLAGLVYFPLWCPAW